MVSCRNNITQREIEREPRMKLDEIPSLDLDATLYRHEISSRVTYISLHPCLSSIHFDECEEITSPINRIVVNVIFVSSDMIFRVFVAINESEK